MKLKYEILVICILISISSVFFKVYPDFAGINILFLFFSTILLTLRNFVIIYFIIFFKEKILIILSISVICWITSSLLLLGLINKITNTSNGEMATATFTSFLNNFFFIICIFFIIQLVKKKSSR